MKLLLYIGYIRIITLVINTHFMAYLKGYIKYLMAGILLR